MLKTTYKDNDLIFVEIIPYTGPVPLRLYEELEMFVIEDKIIIYIDSKYYEVRTVSYLNKIYKRKKKKHNDFFQGLINDYQLL